MKVEIRKMHNEVVQSPHFFKGGVSSPGGANQWQETFGSHREKVSFRQPNFTRKKSS